MLRALTIRNFALVAELDIEFDAGLTVITGESGAGKSILLDALGLVLGARAKRSQLRPGAPSCDVSAEFDIAEQPRSRTALADLDLLAGTDEASCLVRRTAGERRSRAFVNGCPVTLDVLESLTRPLIDIHGQHEHRELLALDVQRRLLDEYGVDAALPTATAKAYRERAALQQELAERRLAVEQAHQRMSLLDYQVDELAALGDLIHRVDELAADHKRLSQAQELMAATGAAIAELDDELLGRVSRLAALFENTDDDHASLRAAAELTSSAHTLLEEALGELRSYLAAFPEDDSQLAELDQALESIHDMARKHRVAATELGPHLAALRAELDTLSASEASLDALAEQAAAADEQYQRAAAALSAARREAAVPFAAEVTATLAELGLRAASLAVEFEQAESAAGLETVTFKAITNPRYPAASLADIASGGELSRIALAIQVVAAQRSQLPCLVLDEADVGIGGTTADVLGRLLRRLSKSTQVIAITHAPQIAALGDTHLLVSKTSDQDVAIHLLDEDDRIEELARQLGGRTVTDDSRAYARTLLAGRDAEAGESR